MKNAWIGVVILAAGITLEGVAQEAGSRTSASSGTTTKDKSANQRTAVKKTPGTNNGGEPANVGASGRRFGTADNPNPGYSSGSGQQGTGKMKSGMSRSGNSNMQTGSTKSGDAVSDPNVTNGQKRPSAPGGSGDAGSDMRESGGRTYRSGSQPASGGRQTRITNTYTQGSTSNTPIGSMSSGAVTNVDAFNVNNCARCVEGLAGKVGSGDEDVNGSTYRRRLSGKGAPATSAATTEGKSGGSGKASSKDTKDDRGIGPNAIPAGQGGTGPASDGAGGAAPGGGSAGGNAGDAASTGQGGQGGAASGQGNASGGRQSRAGSDNANTQKATTRSTTSTTGRDDLYNAQKGSTTGPSGNSNSKPGGNASQRANQSMQNERNKGGNN